MEHHIYFLVSEGLFDDFTVHLHLFKVLRIFADGVSVRYDSTY